MSYNNHNTEPVERNIEALDAGMHISFLMNMGRLQLLIRSGLPFYSGNNEYFKVFNTFGLRYDLGSDFFLALYHKSSGMFNGESIQYGFGYYIRKGPRNY